MRYALLLLLFATAAAADVAALGRPEVQGLYGRVGEALRGEYEVILRPDKSKPEWWAGAPSVVRDADGTFWMACRMRSADLPRGLRGYEIRILKSSDGIQFERVLSIPASAVPIPGFERPALLIDPKSGLFKLYACGPWKDGPWCIVKFDDAKTPADFVASTARPVIVPRAKAFDRDQPPVEYKDPVVIFAEGAYHAFVIGYARQNERIYHFRSDDGEAWAPVGNPYDSLLPLSGWHDFFVRPASVLPLGVGYLFVYEGSKTSWYDPVYNLGTGLAHTFDLNTLSDLTPTAPIAVSNTPGEHMAVFRYSCWLPVNGEIWVYAEVSCPDQTHEVRRYRVR